MYNLAIHAIWIKRNFAKNIGINFAYGQGVAGGIST